VSIPIPRTCIDAALASNDCKCVIAIDTADPGAISWRA
jgi:hypothetical protein